MQNIVHNIREFVPEEYMLANVTLESEREREREEREYCTIITHYSGQSEWILDIYDNKM